MEAQAHTKLKSERITCDIRQHVPTLLIPQPCSLVAGSGSRWCQVSEVLVDMTPVMTDRECSLRCCALVEHMDDAPGLSDPSALIFHLSLPWSKLRRSIPDLLRAKSQYSSATFVRGCSSIC